MIMTDLIGIKYFRWKLGRKSRGERRRRRGRGGRRGEEEEEEEEEEEAALNYLNPPSILEATEEGIIGH